MLHPYELDLASTLRMSCANYLLSKRRIFQGVLDVAKRQKSFIKTDAQNVCSIDVNKASRLWEAFDNVGWFDMKYFKQHMPPSDKEKDNLSNGDSGGGQDGNDGRDVQGLGL